MESAIPVLSKTRRVIATITKKEKVLYPKCDKYRVDTGQRGFGNLT